MGHLDELTDETHLGLKRTLVQGCAVLDSFGITDEQGHLSVRTAPGADTFLINEFSSPGTASLQDFVEVDIDGEIPDDAPAETVIHTEIYRERDDVESICHNHSPYAVTVSSVGLEMRAVHHVGMVQHGPVRVFEDYLPAGGMLITTTEEAQRIVSVLGTDRAVVLRGHGPIVTGGSVTEAVLGSIKLEYNSRLLYLQATIGEPWYLPDELIAEADMYNPGFMQKSLDYYLTNAD